MWALVFCLDLAANDGDGFFTIRMHHGDQFQPGNEIVYIGGRVNHIDLCHIDQLSLVELVNMLKNIRVEYCQIMRFHHRIPTELKILDKDQDVLDIGKWVNMHKVHDAYVEHIREVFDQRQAESNCGPTTQQCDGGNDMGDGMNMVDVNATVVASDNSLNCDSSQYNEQLESSTSDDEYLYDSEYDGDEM
ncbi:unnamed protein product [Ilex paraguariensis]|uniref:PB1-like domain-containing protein n=1 Tax=Ilex paraguariensis TaxID=185542 RepID=A0ABC8R8Z8_9AQUA